MSAFVKIAAAFAAGVSASHFLRSGTLEMQSRNRPDLKGDD